jgi:hypothetical protein
MDRCSDTGLLTYHHRLEDAGVAEAKGGGDGGVAGTDGPDVCGSREGWGQVVQGMADLVDGEMLGTVEGGRFGYREGFGFEEEADFVVGGEEIVVADVLGGLVCCVAASREACEGV